MKMINFHQKFKVLNTMLRTQFLLIMIMKKGIVSNIRYKEKV